MFLIVIKGYWQGIVPVVGFIFVSAHEYFFERMALKYLTDVVEVIFLFWPQNTQWSRYGY